MSKDTREFGPLAWIILGVLALLTALSGIGLADDAATISEREMELVRAAEEARIAVVEHVFDTVVAIYGKNRAAGGGSGVVIHPDGYAVTNFHVVQAAGDHGTAGLADGELYKWRLIGLDPGGDVAIIKLLHPKGKPFKAAKLGDSDAVRVGDFALAMGNPFLLAEDQKPTVTMGIISGIGRYQHGMNDKLLVYGNCLQFDTSINPGNSGGPLFNMAGEVIGINGRGSFEERQRVNVGVGYAISIEQVKNFLPDLLATRVAQHGTLDAIFMQTEAGPICRSVDTDAAIGREGLRPGDRLIRFAGHDIESANQYLNLVTTFPGRWPVEVVWQSGDVQRSAIVRLQPLRYGQARQEEPVEVEPDGKDKKVKIKRKLPNKWQEDRINSKQENRAALLSLLADWRAFRGGADVLKNTEAMRLVQDYIVEGETEGRWTLTLAHDGRFHWAQRYQDGDVTREIVQAFDGKTYWERRGDQLKTLTGEAALRHPVVGLTRALAMLDGRRPLKEFKEAELVGGDMANGERAYRIRLKDKLGGDFVMYFSVMDAANEHLQVRLLKYGHADDERSGTMTTWGDYQVIDGLAVPMRMRAVLGLAEREVADVVAREAEVLKEVEASLFAPPAGMKEAGDEE